MKKFPGRIFSIIVASMILGMQIPVLASDPPCCCGENEIDFIPFSIETGGTSATTAENARTNLSVYSKAEIDSALTKQAIGNLMYPVGSIYLSVNSTNPSTLFGGTWTRWGNGKHPVGLDTGISQYNTVEKTGGNVAHRHDWILGIHWYYGAAGGENSSSSTGAYKWSSGSYDGWSKYLNDLTVSVNSSATAASKSVLSSSKYSQGNTQTNDQAAPYIVCYMWKRTA